MALWNLKKRVGRTPIQGKNGVVFTDKSTAEAFIDSLEHPFSPNHSQDNDLD